MSNTPQNRFQVCCSTCGLVDTYLTWEQAQRRGEAHAARDLDTIVEVFDCMAHRDAIRLKEYDRQHKTWKVTAINSHMSQPEDEVEMARRMAG